MDIKIRIIGGGTAPVFKHRGDACADCHARLEDGVIIRPGERALIPLGFALGLEDGWEALVRPRSGLSLKGIDVCLGTVDASYRGEVKACVVNNSDKPFTVSGGERICQIAVRKIPDVRFAETDGLGATDRGESGFGSTGL